MPTSGRWSRARPPSRWPGSWPTRWAPGSTGPPSDVAAIGRHRRRSVELALDSDGALGPDLVLHCDVDHMLRWIEARPAELDAALRAGSTADLLVVGRSAAAMAQSPRRLRDTETVVNHIYELMTGRCWDLMFAVRCLSPAAARTVVDRCTEDTIANDVEWPLVVDAAGHRLGWFAADGLTYRVRTEPSERPVRTAHAWGFGGRTRPRGSAPRQQGPRCTPHPT